MQRTIINTLIAFCLVGLTSAGIRLLNPATVPPVTVRDQDTDSIMDPGGLMTEHDYDLFVADREVVDQDDSLTWYIQQVDPAGLIDKDFELNESVREWKFKDTGYYEVRAFYHLKEVAHSTVRVIDGDRFAVDWGSGSEQVKGSSFDFRDRSTNVVSRKWVVRRGTTDEEVASSEDARFEWMPVDTGTYTVRVKIETRSGKVERDERTVTVVLAPPEPVANVKPIVPFVPKPNKDAWKPKENPPMPASSSEACFLTKSTEGSNFWVEVDKPQRSEVQFSDESTTFTVSPVYDCIFAGFDYFADSKIDDIEIQIECMSTTCSGKPSWKTRIKGAYDAHKEASANFTSPVLNKAYKYRVTVRPLAPGKLGYYKTKGNNFTSGKSGLAHRDGNATVKMLDVKTCVYHLRFTR